MSGATLDTQRERLRELRLLPFGWLDGEGLPIPDRAGDVADRVLVAVDAVGLPAPAVFPLLDGGVELSWWDGRALVEVEIRLEADEVVLAVMVLRDGWEERVVPDVAELVRVVAANLVGPGL